MRKSKWFVTLAVVLALSLGVVGAPSVASGLLFIFDPAWLTLILFAPTHGFPGVNRTLPFANSYTMLPATGGNQENDVYTVHLLAGQTIDVSLRSTAGNGANHVYLYRASTATTITGSDGLVASSFPLAGTRVAHYSYAVPVTDDYYVNTENDSGTDSMPYRVAASIFDPAGRDVGGAWSKTLPFNAQDFLDALCAPQLSPVNKEDVYAVYMTAGKKYIMTMTGQSGVDSGIYVYKPGTAVVAGNYGADLVTACDNVGTSTENVVYTAAASGTHYVVVRAKDGQAGRYTIDVSEKTVTSITIKTDKTSVYRPKPFILTGVLTGGSVGELVVVWVKKPGKSYWSYSSNRLCYSTAPGGANWWYRYTPIGTTSPKGTYYFKSSFPGSATKEGCVSPTNVTVVVK